jgi:peptide-methionine (S)-S-oxide reductase
MEAARSGVITFGMTTWTRILWSALLLAGVSCADQKPEAPAPLMSAKPAAPQEQTPKPPPAPSEELATFGAGCFWCVEAVFQNLKGVIAVESGYTGGSVDNPTYKQVCTGTTGHAEVSRIKFDPSKISYAKLLEVFWKTHDPTTLNRQGNDEGTQYRSVIYYHNEEQKKLAEKYKKELDASGAWPNPIVTEITPAVKYYKAEEYHQNYFKLNPNQGYCRAIIAPKVEKFKKVFGDVLKKDE